MNGIFFHDEWKPRTPIFFLNWHTNWRAQTEINIFLWCKSFMCPFILRAIKIFGFFDKYSLRSVYGCQKSTQYATEVVNTIYEAILSFRILVPMAKLFRLTWALELYAKIPKPRHIALHFVLLIQLYFVCTYKCI